MRSSWQAAPPGHTVCDGMGGDSGRIAARIATDTMQHFLPARKPCTGHGKDLHHGGFDITNRAM